MYSFRTLEIIGYSNQRVSNTLFWQQETTRQLVIVLPGVGYTCQMPLLYYPSRAAIALGMDVLWIEYNYIRQSDYQALSAAEQNQWLFTDIEAASQVALAQRSYDALTLIGKSSGTLAMSHLLTSNSRLALSRNVWLTPLLRDERVRTKIKSGQHALIVLGTDDPYYDSTYLAELKRTTRNEVFLVQGADHSMEIQGDVLESVAILEKIMRSILAFLSG